MKSRANESYTNERSVKWPTENAESQVKLKNRSVDRSTVQLACKQQVPPAEKHPLPTAGFCGAEFPPKFQSEASVRAVFLYPRCESLIRQKDKEFARPVNRRFKVRPASRAIARERESREPRRAGSDRAGCRYPRASHHRRKTGLRPTDRFAREKLQFVSRVPCPGWISRLDNARGANSPRGFFIAAASASGRSADI